MPSSAVADTATCTRRAFVHASGLALAGSLGVSAPVSASTLATPASLQGELTKALAQDQPLLVMVSLDGCPFCKVARGHYLLPLRDQQGVPVLQLDMRHQTAILDFQGQPRTHDALIRAWRVRVAPTVLFFGRGGKEVAERLVGAYIPDFYGAYLEERVALARASLR